MALVPGPAEFPLTSFWRAKLHKLDSHQSTEDLPPTSDIVVVGAGFAGASIVHHLLSKSRDSSQKPSILILEARGACSGATGRNGGQCFKTILSYVGPLIETQVVISSQIPTIGLPKFSTLMVVTRLTSSHDLKVETSPPWRSLLSEKG